MKTADLGEWIEVLTERAAATEGEWTALLLSGDTEGSSTICGECSTFSAWTR